MVKDKINVRAKGPRTTLTRQTNQGRGNDGGLRIGEMEVWAMQSHGADIFLNESMLVRGDIYYMAICNKTGMIAVYNESKNIFMSPYADGPIKYTEAYDTDIESLKLKHITKHGREFSIVCVPYAFKLLVQELQAMNVQLRFITDDNINQLLSMSYSNNINKLLFNEETNLKELQWDVRKKLKQEDAGPDVLMETPEDERKDKEKQVGEQETKEETEPEIDLMEMLESKDYSKGDAVYYLPDPKKIETGL